MPAAIPLISTGVSIAGGLWNKHKQGQQQKAADAASAPGFAGITAAADQSRQQGQELTQFGQRTLAPAANYYQTLLNGSKAGLTEATAPERAATTDIYRGAERDIQRTGSQGAARDVAEANLNRDRAGKLSGLIQGVRPAAAGALTGIGQGAIGAGQTATGQSANFYSSLLNGLNAKRTLDQQQSTYNDEQNTSLWGNIGKLLTQSYGAWTNRGGGGGGTGITAPNPSATMRGVHF